MPGRKTTHQTPLPSEVMELKERLIQWRSQKKAKYDRIPEDLWADMIKAGQTHGAYRVSKTIGIGYQPLKKRIDKLFPKENTPDLQAPSSNQEPSFVELKLNDITKTSSSQNQLELHDPSVSRPDICPHF